jgi:hypothetical protein
LDDLNHLKQYLDGFYPHYDHVANLKIFLSFHMLYQYYNHDHEEILIIYDHQQLLEIVDFHLIHPEEFV